MYEWFYKQLRAEDVLRLPVLKDLPVKSQVVAGGLQGPAGLALHPQTGVLFVAEPEGHRVVLLRPRGAGLTDSRRVRAGTMDAAEIGMPWGPGERRIRLPRHLDFDAAGRLFVLEACPGGRILCFDASQGLPTNAEVVAHASEDRSRRFVGMSLDGLERPVAASFAVQARDPALRVQVFAENPAGEWGVAAEGFDALPSRPWPRRGRILGRRSGGPAGPYALQETEGDAWIERVAAFLHRLGASGPVGGVAADLLEQCVYFTLREEGVVMRVCRHCGG